MKSVKAACKRLIICCDGTWQSSVSGKRNIPSNVARLARTIARAGQDKDQVTWQQLVYYDSGVGTGSLNFLEQARQGGTGDGLVVNVLEAYNFIVNNYTPGDQIFCFGFSRGGFTARAIAGLITDIGVFKPQSMQNFAPLWALYQRNTAKHDFRKSKDWFQFLNGVRPMVPQGQETKPYALKPWEMAHESELEGETSPVWPKSNVVEVVGVFDTVGSLGLADTRLMDHSSSRKRFEYLNVKLSPFINHAFHALALDERRGPFSPTLWYIPSPETLKKEEDAIDKEDDDWPELKAHRDAVDKEIRDHQVKNKPDLYQVWFPGVHINIGGGSDADSHDAEGLSNLTFAWMVQQLGPYLAFEPWTWKHDIAGYSQQVMREQTMYASMKANMTREEEKQYSALFDKGRVESAQDYVTDWADWILASGKRIFHLGKEIKMVPVPPEKIVRPKKHTADDGDCFATQWGVSTIEDSYNWMYKLMGNPLPRTPGECCDKSREQGPPLRNLGKTNEYIHPSVWWRKTNKGISSQSLDKFERKRDTTYGSLGYWKASTKVWIPEWFIRPSKDDLANYPEFAAEEGKEEWEHAEWSYVDTVVGSDELQKHLVEFYVTSRQAKANMTKAGTQFPFAWPQGCTGNPLPN